MKRKTAPIGVVLLLILWVVTGCGVSRGEYDKATSDLGACNSQVAGLQAEYDQAKAKIATLEANAASADQEAAGLKAKMAKAKALTKTIDSIVISALAGQKMTQVDLLAGWISETRALGDPVAAQKLQEMIDSGGATAQTKDFCSYLLDSLARTLE